AGNRQDAGLLIRRVSEGGQFAGWNPAQRSGCWVAVSPDVYDCIAFLQKIHKAAPRLESLQNGKGRRIGMGNQSGKPTATEFLFGELFVDLAGWHLRGHVCSRFVVALHRRELAKEIIEVRTLRQERWCRKAEQKETKSKEPAAK